MADVAVLSVDVNIAIVRVDVRCTAAGASCPGCGAWSAQVHGSYLRFPADVPCGGRNVVLQLRGRRFTCRNAECGRRTFVEQIPGLTRRYGQRTERLRSTLAAIGLALAGRAGARLADIVGAPVSRSTLLRLVDALPEPEVPAPRVVGVDEYATRKGRHYGTVLVDVETRRPVDLLPDRESSSLAAWLAQRPGIEVVCRDRAPFFAEGATAGAPQAVQVSRIGGTSGTTSATPPSGASPSTADACASWYPRHLKQPRRSPTPQRSRPASPWPTGHRFADRTRTTHATVHALVEAGHSRRAIQRQLGMTSRTVKRYADAAKPEDLFTGQWQTRTSVLDEYKAYLDDRWNEGCTNAWKLWEEIVPLGYQGSYQRVRAYLRQKRTSPQPVTARLPSPHGSSAARKPSPRPNTSICRTSGPTAPDRRPHQARPILRDHAHRAPGRATAGLARRRQAGSPPQPPHPRRGNRPRP
ncbi:ISL3 family transposase [Streptomyces sp. NPDC051219]|uniref:ISL3 family transposase n=1 Tax=Streptomyces sp. NPDC051219 TaxID=3155283 RepID=UPI00341A23EF